MKDVIKSMAFDHIAKPGKHHGAVIVDAIVEELELDRQIVHDVVLQMLRDSELVMGRELVLEMPRC